MHIAFLGFGLIAGSVARAVRTTRALDGWTMAGWSPSGAGPEQARVDGVDCGDHVVRQHGVRSVDVFLQLRQGGRADDFEEGASFH